MGLSAAGSLASGPGGQQVMAELAPGVGVSL